MQKPKPNLLLNKTINIQTKAYTLHLALKLQITNAYQCVFGIG